MERPSHINPPIPHSSLAEGIAHGPYQAAPTEIVDLYVERHLQNPELEPTVSESQKRADIESEWQYDQHAAAVIDALEHDRLTHQHAHYMLEKVLRPWFIGRRNPNE